MKKHWGILGSLVALLVVLIGVVVWQQSQPAKQSATSAKESRRKEADVKRTVAKQPKAKPWLKLKKPLKLPILMYHSISSGNSLRVPARQFQQEMAYLQRHHYRTLTADEAVRALTTNTVPQKKVVWVTLDDAYKDNLTHGLPALEQAKVHATINAITGFTHKSNHLTLSEMKQMKATGRVDFASHTVQHLDLNEITAAQQKTELVNSKKWLDAKLNQKTQVLCYPAGRADRTTHRLAKQAGYSIALTTQEGMAQMSQGRYNLSRLRVIPGMSTATFASLIAVNNR